MGDSETGESEGERKAEQEQEVMWRTLSSARLLPPGPVPAQAVLSAEQTAGEGKGGAGAPPPRSAPLHPPHTPPHTPHPDKPEGGSGEGGKAAGEAEAEGQDGAGESGEAKEEAAGGA